MTNLITPKDMFGKLVLAALLAQGWQGVSGQNAKLEPIPDSAVNADTLMQQLLPYPDMTLDPEIERGQVFRLAAPGYPDLLIAMTTYNNDHIRPAYHLDAGASKWLLEQRTPSNTIAQVRRLLAIRDKKQAAKKQP